MPYDSAGRFSLVQGYLATTGQTILVSQHNPVFEDIASGMSKALLRTGVAPMQANLVMGGFKVTGIADGSDATDAASVGQIGTQYGAQVGAAASKATPVDADYLALYDSAASNTLRKLTWANIKATLKSYLDTLYPPVARTITGAGLATGGGDMSANRTITVTEASQAEAQAGTASNVGMTPRRTTDALNARIYTGTSANFVDFPLGHIVLAALSSPPNRNQRTTLYLSAGFDNRYTDNAGDTAGTLAGSWACHGVFQGVSGFNFGLMQRVA